jgi:hypothetical protein
MSDFLRHVQSALYLASSTIDVWRDAAVMGLAGVVIVCLWLAVETA